MEFEEITYQNENHKMPEPQFVLLPPIKIDMDEIFQKPIPNIICIVQGRKQGKAMLINNKSKKRPSDMAEAGQKTGNNGESDN